MTVVATSTDYFYNSLYGKHDSASSSYDSARSSYSNNYEPPFSHRGGEVVVPGHYNKFLPC